MTINTDLQKIVVERLRRLPSHLQISIGNTSYSNEELVSSVKEGTKLGQQIMGIQLDYLQDLASGKIYLDE